jgi:hypothetical protein
MLTGVIDATRPGVSDVALLSLRERARRLILDGRALRVALDGERDADLLATINRAEVFLEEVAALEPGGMPVFFTQGELADLRRRLADADAEGAAARALSASGWIASDSGL